MSEIGSKKIEQCAIEKINDIIGQIITADSHLSINDKSISWDGTIDFYKGNIDKKKNFDFSVDVQVKGRTTPSKKLGDKATFEVSVVDMENFQKKDGTLFLLVRFSQDLKLHKVYYFELLPYNIIRELDKAKRSKTNKIKIKMKELKDGNQLESICRNFQINKSIQKRMNKEAFLTNYIEANPTTVAKFIFWEKDSSNITPEKFIGRYHFFYTMDENDNPIGISYGMFYDFSKDVNTEISTLDKSIIYKGIVYTKTASHELFTFGKAFTVNCTSKLFNIKICGTLNERIDQLIFINKSIKEKKFMIGNSEFLFNDDMDENQQFIHLEKMFIDLRNLLNKHGIVKDLNLDSWKNEEITELFNWLNTMEDKKDINLKSNYNMIGSKTINEVKLSVIATKRDNNLFTIESIWRNGNYDRYSFKHESPDRDIISNNLFLNLNSEAYLADDIDYEEMKNAVTQIEFTKDECLLMNFQVLDILKAYDYSNNMELLDYSEYLTTLLLEKDKEAYEIYYINYCQILKRKNGFSSAEIEELIKIRDDSNKPEIKLCCNALIDNKAETTILLKKLDDSTKRVLYDYPISIYF